MGSIPPPIEADGLAIGIEDDIFGIGDVLWLAAAEGCPEEEEQAAAASASAPTPTTLRKAERGRRRPREQDVDMNGPPQVPAFADGHTYRRLR